MSPAAADANLAALVAKCEGNFSYFELVGDGRLGVYSPRDFERFSNLQPILLPYDQQRAIAPTTRPGTTVGWTCRYLNQGYRLYAACDAKQVAYGRALALWAAVDWLTLKAQCVPVVTQSLLPRTTG